MKMGPYVLRWKDVKTFDVIDENLFSTELESRPIKHQVIGSDLGRAHAKCLLTVRGDMAELDYGAFQEFNVSQDMELGAMRLKFTDLDRTEIEKVEWKDEGADFRPGKVEIIHRGLYQELKKMASEGKTGTYKVVGTKVGIPIRGPGDVGRMSGYLDTISRFEHAQHRPLLSAVVVRKGKNGRPGPGFFPLAWELYEKTSQDEAEFYKEELEKVFAHWRGAILNEGNSQQPSRFWIEQYWPANGRDLSRLYVWIHEGNQKKEQLIRAGDHVLFYEVGKHPVTKEKGAKTLFACGRVTGVREDIPEAEYPGGGKKWTYRRPVVIDVALPSTAGVPLDQAKKVLGYVGWPQQGFPINQEQYQALRGLLVKKQEENNLTAAVPPVDPAVLEDGLVGYEMRQPPSVNVGDVEVDPVLRAEALEKAHDAHVELLNKLAEKLRLRGGHPKKGRHIDLACSIDGESWIFEAKSSHEGNYLAQVRHGLAQLYEYRFRQRDKGAKLCLVVQTPPPNGLGWVVPFLTEDRSIDLCWPIPSGFCCTNRNLEKVLGGIEGVAGLTTRKQDGITNLTG